LWKICGQRLTLKYKQDREPHKRGGLRKCIRGFSKQARFRMLKRVAEIDWRNVGPSLFITLTYPDDVAHNDKDRRNKERYLFLRYIENYLCTRVCGLWRVEYKPRLSGARQGEVLSHIHVFIFGVAFIPAGKLRWFWQSAIGSGITPMVNVQRAKDGLRAVRYIAKYCGKVVEPSIRLDEVTYLNSGRHYGYHLRRCIPLCLECEFPLLDPELLHKTRVIAGCHMKYLDLDYFETFTLIGEFAVKLAECLMERHLDDEGHSG